MNNTQNRKIAQVKDEVMVVGIDVGSESHYARAFDNRGYEFSAKPFKFENSEQGFSEFTAWAEDLRIKNGFEKILPGMEPTGHYWFCLGSYLTKNNMVPVMVNPHHVKKSKELDDNSPTKNDRKDPKVIAGLVNAGRYNYTYLPEGVYAELRTASNLRFNIEAELTSIKNKIARWFSIYFPEYTKVYSDLEAKSGLALMKVAPMPEDIVKLGVKGIIQIWKKEHLKGIGKDRAERLVAAAQKSIGIRAGKLAAQFEIKILIEDFENKNRQMDEILKVLDDLLKQIPGSEKLLKIKGIGLKTVAGFLAEVGDLRRFKDAKQIQKYAGLSFKENSSGKDEGKTKINKRGRKRLRYLLYLASKPLVTHNPEFVELHRYYTKRAKNPLKKIQSLIAVGCKLIRVFYTLLTKNIEYDAEKLLKDIKRPIEFQPVV